MLVTEEVTAKLAALCFYSSSQSTEHKCAATMKMLNAILVFSLRCVKIMPAEGKQLSAITLQWNEWYMAYGAGK